MTKIKKYYEVFKKYGLTRRILTILLFVLVMIFAMYSNNNKRPYEDSTIMLIISTVAIVAINVFQIFKTLKDHHQRFLKR